MKIDHDLRAAIRSAHSAQRRNRDGFNRWDAEKKAIAEIAKIPAVGAKLRKAKTLRAKASLWNAAADDLEKSVGIHNANYIHDHALFQKSGGRAIIEPGKPWGFDAVMAELAAASEKDGKAILKRIGIDWS